MLYIFGGLPGVGKSTLARELARERKATYIRIDTIEQAFGRRGRGEIGPLGYLAAYELAVDNLCLGASVIADSANTLEITRAAWREVAARSGCRYVEIEVVCSDRREHRTRVEARLEGDSDSNQPSWRDVVNREYEPWDTPTIVVDTAAHSVAQSVSVLLSALKH